MKKADNAGPVKTVGDDQNDISGRQFAGVIWNNERSVSVNCADNDIFWQVNIY